MRSTRRTTLRTAAVVAGAATVLALPVGSAFADSPAVPGPPVGPSVDSRVAPARAFVTAVKLADGSVAKVYRVGRSHFEADIYAAGTKLDTLVSRGSAAAYGQSNGLHVVLQPNGTVTSWLDGAPKPAPKPKPQPKRSRSRSPMCASTGRRRARCGSPCRTGGSRSWSTARAASEW